MKRILFIFILALACIGVRAQHTVYCEIMQFGTAGMKSIISVDFGNDGADEIIDEKGKKIKFKSSIDALSFFEKLGWSVVSAYSVIHATGIANVPVVHYLLKKDVSSYDEKMEGIYTKRTEPTKKLELGDDGYFN